MKYFMKYFRTKNFTSLVRSATIKYSTPCKYKMVRDIEKLAGIYHYVVEASCCAKFYRNRLPHFGWANRESFSFFLTHKQTNFDQLCLRSKPPKKRNFWGVNRHIKPIRQKIQIPYLQNYASDYHKIWQDDVAQGKDFVGGPIWWRCHTELQKVIII